MAELELADWKYLRSFRLIAVDPHAGGTSFVDLTYRRLNNGGAPPSYWVFVSGHWCLWVFCGWPLALPIPGLSSLCRIGPPCSEQP